MTRAVDSFANWTYFKNEHPAVKSRRYLKVRNFLTCQERSHMKEQKIGFGIALGHQQKSTAEGRIALRRQIFTASRGSMRRLLQRE